MSAILANALGGEFATSRRGLSQDEVAFIDVQARRGRTAAQISQMLRRSLCDVQFWMPSEASLLAPEPWPEVVADEGEPAPRPGDIVLSLWRGLLVVPPRGVTRDEIAREVAARYGVTVAAMKGPSRKKVFVVARQEAMWRMVEAHRWSTPQIGHWFGDRDHTTVLHGHKAHARRLAALKPPVEAEAA